MSYTKQIWDTSSYVNPTRMNHIEEGIKDASDTADGTEEALNTIIQTLMPQSESGLTVRAVFGNNNSSGVCTSGMIPLLLADSCNITITDMLVVGTSTHIDLTKIVVGNKTKYGFALACGDYANVQDKSVTVTYSYTRN